MTAVLELRDVARAELNEIFFARHRAGKREDDDRDQDTPEVEPAMSPSIPGRTYENPNEDEEYTPPEEQKAVTDYEDDYDDEDEEDDDEDLEDDEDDEL